MNIEARIFVVVKVKIMVLHCGSMTYPALFSMMDFVPRFWVILFIKSKQTHYFLQQCVDKHWLQYLLKYRANYMGFWILLHAGHIHHQKEETDWQYGTLVSKSTMLQQPFFNRLVLATILLTNLTWFKKKIAGFFCNRSSTDYNCKM